MSTHPLSAPALQHASNRMHHIQAYLASAQTVEAYCTSNPTAPSKGTMYRYLKAHKEGGLTALAPNYGTRKGSTTIPQEAQTLIAQLYLNQNKIALSYCCTLVSNQLGYTISYDAARRWLKTIPQAFIDKYRQGAKYFNDHHIPHITRDYTKRKVLQEVVMDHHMLDIFVQLDGKIKRVWLSVAMDMRSRYILAWRIVAIPNSLTVAEIVYETTTKHGVAANYYIDNGADYTSKLMQGVKQVGEASQTEVQGIFQSIGSNVITAIPYHPESKPVERFFKEVATKFSKLWQSYAGSNTADRPDQVKSLWTTNKQAIAKLPTILDLQSAFTQWLSTYYHQTPHGGKDMAQRSPETVFCTEPRVDLPSIPEEYLPIVFSRRKHLTVYQSQVKWRNINYYADKLILYSGNKVECLRPIFNINTLYIRDLQGNYICQAEGNALLEQGSTEDTLKQLSRAKKDTKQQLAHYQLQGGTIAHYQITTNTGTATAIETPVATPTHYTLTEEY